MHCNTQFTGRGIANGMMGRTEWRAHGRHEGDNTHANTEGHARAVAHGNTDGAHDCATDDGTGGNGDDSYVGNDDHGRRAHTHDPVATSSAR
jgi:hypothetical protein